jgi:outer membrane protein assembly factor BamB
MKKLTITVLAAALLQIGAGGCLGEASDWTAWRGPSGNGVSDETGWNPQKVNNRSAILWRASVGKGHSTISVSGEYLYTMGTRESQAGGETRYEEVIYCLDTRTGKEVWRYSYPAQQQPFHGPGSTPVIDSDLLYATSRSGEVLCFDARNGKVVWKRSLIDESLCRASRWGFHGSPVVDGERLILNAGRSGIALDKRTGKVIWASTAETGGHSTPVLFDIGGKRLAAISAAGKVYTVDAASGDVLWSYEWESNTDPIVTGSRMLLVGGHRATGSVMLEMSSGKPEVAWKSKAMANHFQTGVVLGNHAYRIGRNAKIKSLQCVDLGTGEVRWSQDLGDSGGLIAGDGKLIIITGRGDLVIAEATPEQYRELARTRLFQLKPLSRQDDQPNSCWTAPVLANGRIYARTSWGELACVDVLS